MRRFDKNENIRKVNLLAEQRYLQSKGSISDFRFKDDELRDEIKNFIKNYSLIKDIEVSIEHMDDKTMLGMMEKWSNAYNKNGYTPPLNIKANELYKKAIQMNEGTIECPSVYMN